jgi:hypothetical protein
MRSSSVIQFNFLCFFLLCTPPCAYSAGTIEKWLSEVEVIIKNTDRYRVFDEKISSSSRLAKNSYGNTPWALSSNLSRNDRHPFEEHETTAGERGYSLTNTLAYTSTKDWEARLESASTFTRKQNSFNAQEQELQESFFEKRFVLRPSLYYELYRRGDRSPVRLTSMRSELIYNREVVSGQYEIDLLVQELQESYSQIFISTCNKYMLQGLQPLIEQTIKTGRAQLDAKLISVIEFLQFESLGTDLAKRQMRLDQEIEQNILKLTAIDEQLANFALSKINGKSFCVLNEVINVTVPEITDTDIQKMRLLDAKVQLASLDSKISAIDHRILQTQTDASIKAFALSDYEPEIDKRRTDAGSTGFGVSVDWVLPVSYSGRRQSEALNQKKLAERSFELALKEAASQLDTRAKKIKFNKKYLDLLTKEVANLKRIEDVNLQALKSGVVESVSYSSALNRLIVGQSEIWSLYGQILSDALYLRRIQKKRISE